VGWKSKEIVSSIRGTRNLIHVTPCNYAVVKLYKDASAFIAPSLSEGFDMPNVEAQLVGIESAVSRIPVHEELCSADTIFFDPNDVNDIGCAIESLGRRTSIQKRSQNQSNWNSSFLKFYERITASIES
jgi:glycosyltransferase involved in cell wall biosynthesis